MKRKTRNTVRNETNGEGLRRQGKEERQHETDKAGRWKEEQKERNIKLRRRRNVPEHGIKERGDLKLECLQQLSRD